MCRGKIGLYPRDVAHLHFLNIYFECNSCIVFFTMLCNRACHINGIRVMLRLESLCVDRNAFSLHQWWYSPSSFWYVRINLWLFMTYVHVETSLWFQQQHAGGDGLYRAFSAARIAVAIGANSCHCSILKELSSLLVPYFFAHEIQYRAQKCSECCNWAWVAR